MPRTLLLTCLLAVFSVNASSGQLFVSPGPPVDPENWVHFTLDWSLAEWQNGGTGASLPGFSTVRNGPLGGIQVFDDSFWVMRSANPARLIFRVGENEQFGVDRLAPVSFAPELNSGLPAFTAMLGPRTSVVWNAENAEVTRNITFTAPGYSRVGMPIPEPDTLTLAACAALAALRRRRGAR